MPLAMQQLIAAAVTLFATAPPALLSLPRTSAAVPELLFGILLLHASVSETPTHRCKRPQPGKLVHHHASTSEQALPTPPRCAANATRQNRRARGRVTRNPHPGKKIGGPIDTRALACRADVQEAFRNATQPTAPPRLCSQPRAAPRRHHCRAHGPERHRRQDV